MASGRLWRRLCIGALLAVAGGLAVTAQPVTLPSAILYIQQGTELPWLAIAALIAGLWIGTGIGARFANCLSLERLRLAMILTIAALALFMAFKAVEPSTPFTSRASI